MSLESIGGAGGAWLIAALALGVAELVAPGLFLVFFAIAAAVVGVVTLAAPTLPLWAQLAAFLGWSGLTVFIGRRWYRDYPVATQDPLLNDRAARLVGTVVVVEQALVAGHGRVSVGDGGWPATGPDLPVGATARVVAVEGTVLRIEVA